MDGGHAIVAMLALAAAGAVSCLALPRPRLVLVTIAAVSLAELALAGRLWPAVIGEPGFVTAVEGWFYVDAFSAFHLVVLALVFVLSSVFASVYFGAETGEHRPNRARH